MPGTGEDYKEGHKGFVLRAKEVIGVPMDSEGEEGIEGRGSQLRVLEW